MLSKSAFGLGLEITACADLKSGDTHGSGPIKKSFATGRLHCSLFTDSRSLICYISSQQTNRNFHQHTHTSVSEASLSSICTAIQRLSFLSIVSTHLSLRVISYSLCQRICLAVSIALQHPQPPTEARFTLRPHRDFHLRKFYRQKRISLSKHFLLLKNFSSS